MSARRGDGWRGVLSAAGIAVAVALSSPGPLQAQDYIQDDAKISGGEVYTFTDGAERVTVVVGNFQLTAGKRRVNARDGVVWIRTTAGARGERHDMMIYAEGGATVTEAGGAATSDRLMLVEVHVQGAIRLARPPVEKDLAELPIYQRAKESRAAGVAAGATAPPTPHAPPPLLILSRPGTVAPQPAPGPKTTGPPPAERTPPKAKPLLAVGFYAKNTATRKTERGHVLVLSGDVYLSQGAEGGRDVLELRCQAAVVFVEPVEPKDARTPFSPPVTSLPIPGADPNGPRESIAGVYLLDDVTISRGERTLRGPEAYYDFTTDRALIREPVFRAIQEQREIPVYVRASEGRMLSARELWFKDAQISSSDFHTPTYSMNAKQAYLMDETHYDDEGVRVSPQKWKSKLDDVTFNLSGHPMAWLPHSEGEVTEENLAIRKVQAGNDRDLGFGVETEWYLFRLLGLVPPEGFVGLAEINGYQNGVMIGANLKYARQSFSGYSKAYGFWDRKQEDNFGDQREDISAPAVRGWLLARHKQLIDDWEVQLELSYLSDKNYLERFFPEEFFSGKEQETLVYAKKQRDNWAFTALLQYRLNRFQQQTESYPDFAGYLLGEPVGDYLTYYGEAHAGIKRFRTANDDANDSSDYMGRGDTRQEIDLPLHLGPVNIVHYAAGRASGWSDAPAGGDNFRPYGQVGVKASTQFWRQDKSVESRLWDLHGLRHVLTPEAHGFLSTTGGVEPDDLFPMDPDIEQHVMQMQAWTVGLSQRLQTRRGPPGQERTVDWMRFDLRGGQFVDLAREGLYPGDGRSFFSRPEYSLPRDHATAEYQWQISDSALFMSDMNYDFDDQQIDRYSFGLSLQRTPRLEYFFGLREMRLLNSTVGTAGLNYQLTDKYRVSIFEQYDFVFRDGHNATTGVTLVRKIERWYGAVTASYSQTDNEVAVFLTFWPEGIPELHLGTRRLNLLGSSASN